METESNHSVYPWYYQFNAETGTQQGPYEFGLTKREYFAALALQGILANSDLIERDAFAVREAVAHADALISELNKKVT